MKNFRAGAVHYTKCRVIFHAGTFVTTGQKHNELWFQGGVIMKLCTSISGHKDCREQFVVANLREKGVTPFPPRGR